MRTTGWHRSLNKRGICVQQRNNFQAYELAREALGSESPQAYAWWGELKTRPYMRARHGLAWAYWRTGCFLQAIEERAPSQELLQRVVGKI